MAVEIPNPLEHLRSAGLHRLIFRDQKPPLLQVIAFNRPVVAVVAHRIVLQWSDPISEFVNMHSNDGNDGRTYSSRSTFRSVGNSFIHNSAIAMVPTPPSTAAGTVPN